MGPARRESDRSLQLQGGQPCPAGPNSFVRVLSNGTRACTPLDRPTKRLDNASDVTVLKNQASLKSAPPNPPLRRGISNYCWKTGGGPLTRFHFRLTFTSTRFAILMKGMLLFMP
jgi:hypothetical protein